MPQPPEFDILRNPWNSENIDLSISMLMVNPFQETTKSCLTYFRETYKHLANPDKKTTSVLFVLALKKMNLYEKTSWNGIFTYYFRNPEAQEAVRILSMFSENRRKIVKYCETSLATRESFNIALNVWNAHLKILDKWDIDKGKSYQRNRKYTMLVNLRDTIFP